MLLWLTCCYVMLLIQPSQFALCQLIALLQRQLNYKIYSLIKIMRPYAKLLMSVIRPLCYHLLHSD
jgi:hypothetical protein